MRHYSSLDKLIGHIDLAAQTLLPAKNRHRKRPTPQAVNNKPLNEEEKKQVAGLMRINHAGEVCAQALYQGQALTAKLKNVKEKMQQSAAEEIDHLAWCEQRLNELNAHTSYLNPFWYAASLSIGAIAGAIGDKWSLGFVVETEKQVTAHLEKHLTQLPPHDKKTKAILAQMQKDEMHHAHLALDAGGAKLPLPIKKAMRYTSKVMTTLAYYI